VGLRGTSAGATVCAPSPTHPIEGTKRSNVRPERGAGPGRLQGLPRKPPRAAAVVLTCGEGGPFYAEALRKARERISLADLNIERTRIRKAATGAVLIEIPGEETKAKADELAEAAAGTGGHGSASNQTCQDGRTQNQWSR